MFYEIIISSKSFCISLIIPSTIEDFIKCSNILIKSVCNSIKYPHEIVMIISGVSDISMFKNLTEVMNSLKKCTNKLVLYRRKKKYNAASNRNMGYKLSHCSIISFFDIDDIMSIYRIHILNKIFKENRKIDIAFHSSTNDYNKLDKNNITHNYYKYAVLNKYDAISSKCRKTFIFDNRIYKCDVSNGFFITNGWPTLKRNIMNNIKFNESLYSTEDLDFISRIVKYGYKVALFKYPLGFYIKDNTCSNSYI